MRRYVLRVGISYVAGAWLLVQVAGLVLPAFGAAPAIMQALIVVLAVGLPVAVGLALIVGGRSTESDSAAKPAGLFADRRVDFVIIAILAAGLLLSAYGNLRGPATSPEPVSILIADFENATGNSAFTGVLEETLGIGLEVAPFIDVFSRPAAISVLAELPAANGNASSLTLEAASVIALRQGLDLVIAGEVSQDGDAVSVAVRGIAPGEQREVFSATESAGDETEILEAIASVANRVRLALGDSDRESGPGARESFAVSNVEAAAAYLRAQDLQINQEFNEAIEYYQQAIELDPDFARAYAGLAISEQYLGRMDAAAQHWNEALARLDLLTGRGRLRTLGNYFMIFQRDYDNALETYEQLIEQYPADNVGYNNLAVTAFQAMDFDRALEVGRAIVERYPHYLGYRGNLALYAMYASNFDEASEVALGVLRDDPTNVYANIVLALTAALEGDLTSAEARYAAMSELGPFGRSVASEGLADLALRRGDPGSAVSILDNAIEVEVEERADLAAALKRVMRAEALLALNRPDSVIESLDAAIPSAGGDPAVLVPAALMFAEIGEVTRAEAIAAELSSETSRVQRAYARIILAQLASRAGNHDGALEHANSAIDVADLWLARFYRAQVHLAAGSIDAAAADLQACAGRPGEAAAVFLNDRPSLRYLRSLEATMASLNARR